MGRFLDFTPLKSHSKSALCQLTEAAGGKKVEHFRTLSYGVLEIKFFFTDRKIILMKFFKRQYHGIEYRLRYPKDSLLSVESYIDEYLRTHQVEQFAVFKQPISANSESRAY